MTFIKESNTRISSDNNQQKGSQTFEGSIDTRSEGKNIPFRKSSHHPFAAIPDNAACCGLIEEITEQLEAMDIKNRPKLR
mmetsp:Transcript_3830/g.7516  ORF Transcript_3830/g.7516 Transcript_3830/m.7516 type:complete len:80 (-) Transcript_3830:543-782(-)